MSTLLFPNNTRSFRPQDLFSRFSNNIGGLMGQRYNCRKCNKAIPDRRSSSEELDICRHCFSKMEYGVSDPKTCFQGSVITLED
tara:strand:+ start:409 stop:660 length:252 start_codon:yes stop_codon:yes gene_type:complete